MAVAPASVYPEALYVVRATAKFQVVGRAVGQQFFFAEGPRAEVAVLDEVRIVDPRVEERIGRRLRNFMGNHVGRIVGRRIVVR